MRLRPHWSRAWRDAGVSAPNEGLFAELIARYREPHRKYHTIRHIAECFGAFGDVAALASHPGEVALAIWFHDAIYDVTRSDNEQRSAAWARASMLAAGAAHDASDRVSDLVMATRDHAVAEAIDAAILVDVDLAILGADPDRFDEYERQIREEYAWVPEAAFREHRKAILGAFLGRPTIFGTKHFVERYEGRARANIVRSLERLSDPARG